MGLTVCFRPKADIQNAGSCRHKRAQVYSKGGDKGQCPFPDPGAGIDAQAFGADIDKIVGDFLVRRSVNEQLGRVDQVRIYDPVGWCLPPQRADNVPIGPADLANG